MLRRERDDPSVVTVPSDAPVGEAAERMATHGVGSVIVVDAESRPIGIVTDRDLALRVIGEGRESGGTPVAAVMSQPLVTEVESAPLERIASLMREKGVRRVVLLSGTDGSLQGLVSLDDVMGELSGHLARLAEAAREEMRRARRSERLRKLRGDLERVVTDCVDEAERLGERAHEVLSRELASLRDRLRGTRDD